MEVTTVSPSPASPTEGDKFCETDVTNVAIHSVTLLICLCGLAGNWAVLRLLSLEDRNLGIFFLTISDFLFLLFIVPSALLFLVEDMSCSPIMPLLYVNVVFQLSMISFYFGLFLLLLSTYSLHRLFQLCFHGDLPERLEFVLIAVYFWVFFALFIVIPTVTSLCPSNEKDHCKAALISMYAIILLLFAVPVVISRTIDIIKAKCGSKKQPPKRRNIVIFIIALFTLLLSLCNFLQQLGYILVPFQVVFLLTCIHSSIKPFIYFLAGRCWTPCSMESLRLSLQRVFDKKQEHTAGSDDANTDSVI